jgi:hypothetical protein
MGQIGHEFNIRSRLPAQRSRVVGCERIEILAMPRPDDRIGSTGAPVLSGAAGAPDFALPAAGGTFAPFMPLSTSKNAETDGL